MEFTPAEELDAPISDGASDSESADPFVRLDALFDAFGGIVVFLVEFEPRAPCVVF